jgi:hypothetical protein
MRIDPPKLKAGRVPHESGLQAATLSILKVSSEVPEVDIPMQTTEARSSGLLLGKRDAAESADEQDRVITILTCLI